MTSSCWIRLRSRNFASMFFGRVVSSGSRMPAAATDPRQPEMVLPTTGILQDENGKVGMCAFITFPVSFPDLCRWLSSRQCIFMCMFFPCVICSDLLQCVHDYVIFVPVCTHLPESWCAVNICLFLVVSDSLRDVWDMELSWI